MIRNEMLAVHLTRLSICAAAFSLALGVACAWVSLKMAWMESDILAMACVPFSAAFLFSLAAALQGSLWRASETEAADAESGTARSKLLDASSDTLRPAATAYKGFTAWSGPATALLTAVVLAIWLEFFWSRWIGRPFVTPPVDPAKAALTAVILGLGSFLAGTFCVGQSRDTSFRWLRSVGGWLVAAALAQSLLLLDAASTQFRWGIPFGTLAWVAWWGVLLLCAELVVNAVLEFYRPRGRAASKGAPAFESRILSIITEPGGTAKKLSDILDYQFGMRVDSDGVSRFWWRGAVPIFLFMGGTLWVSTCIAEIGPSSYGFVEAFGKRTTDKPLGSGVHFKLPWPFGAIRTFDTGMLRELQIGSKSKSSKGGAEVVLWTKAHYESESRYILAADPQRGGGEAEPEANVQGVPVSILVTSLRLQYRIVPERLVEFAYSYQYPEHVLTDISESILVEYLAGMNLIQFLTIDRDAAAVAFKSLTQKAVDAEKLGVEIVMVSLLDTHPPVEEVAPAFQEVVGAGERREALIQEAEAFSIRSKLQAQAESEALKSQADAYGVRTAKLAAASATRFAGHLAAYKEAPGLFRLRMILEAVEKDLTGIPKIVTDSRTRDDVYSLNMEEKPIYSRFGEELVKAAAGEGLIKDKAAGGTAPAK